MNIKELREKAEKLLASSRLEELRATLEEAQKDIKGLNDTGQMWLRYYQARLAWARQDWPTTERGFRKLLAEDLPADLRAKVLLWLGESLHYGGQWQEQLILEQEALILSSVLGDDSNRAAIYNLMGWTHLRQSRVQDALVAFECSLRLCQQLDSREQEAWSLSNLGTVHQRLGDPAKALDAHRASLAIRREEGLRLEEGRSLRNIARVLVSTGNWREADKHLRDAETIAREVGDQIGLSYAMMTRGQWEQGQGRLEQALTAYRQALALRGVIGSQALVAETHWAIAETYHLMGDWLKAAGHAEKTANAWREVVKPWTQRENK